MSRLSDKIDCVCDFFAAASYFMWLPVGIVLWYGIFTGMAMSIEFQKTAASLAVTVGLTYVLEFEVRTNGKYWRKAPYMAFLWFFLGTLPIAVILSQ